MLRVLNVMLGKGLGGIEQASLDHAQALTLQGAEVLTVLSPGAAIEPAFRALEMPVVSLRNLGAWDWLARRRLHAQWRNAGSALALAHGNRALSLLAGGPGQVISVIHNYRLQHLSRADAVIAVTPALARRAETLGFPPARVLTLSNMLAAIPPLEARAANDPPVIGALGRFVAKKGFASFLQALALLRERGVPFRAVLGGAGEEGHALRALAASLELTRHLRWPGWVEDKPAFYRSLDVLCLPSLEEPFGIVLLEAFAHGVPVVTSDAEGPQQIVDGRDTAVVYPKESPAALAAALEALLADPDRCARLSRAAYADVSARYAMPVVGARLAAWLSSVAAGVERNTETNPSAM